MQETSINVSVVDSFDIRANTPGSHHAPGLVVMIDGRQCGFQLPTLGDRVEFRRPDGVVTIGQIEEIKEHGEGRSFFISTLTRADAPIGSVMSWRRTTQSSASRGSQTLVKH